VVVLDVWSDALTLVTSGNRLLNTIQGVCERGWRRVLLNLTEVPLIDAEGLTEIIQGAVAVQTAGAAVISPSTVWGPRSASCSTG
jgi:hypothetical protein